MSKPLVYCRELSVNQNGKTILIKINLEVMSGQSLAVLGPNGAGKTSLLRSLAGIIPHVVGEVKINEFNPIKLSPKILSENLVYLPQNPMCAWDFKVSDFAEISGNNDLFEHWIHCFKIKDKWNSQLSKLSGGEKKLVHLGLAFSALGNPLKKILLLDEPTATLDHDRAHLVSEAIKEFTEAGASVIVTTHDISLAKSCKRILVLNEGQVLKEGSPENLLTAELVKVIGNK